MAHILIVESDPDLRQFLTVALQHHFSNEVLVASSQAEAGHLLNQYQVCLVVVDFDYGDYCEATLQQQYQAPVLVLSNFPLPLNCVITGSSYGVLPKPFTYQELRAALGALLVGQVPLTQADRVI